MIEDDLLGIQPQRESESDVIDVDIVDAEYTDAIMNHGSALPPQIKIKTSQTSTQPHHLDRWAWVDPRVLG